MNDDFKKANDATNEMLDIIVERKLYEYKRSLQLVETVGSTENRKPVGGTLAKFANDAKRAEISKQSQSKGGQLGRHVAHAIGGDQGKRLAHVKAAWRNIKSIRSLNKQYKEINKSEEPSQEPETESKPKSRTRYSNRNNFSSAKNKVKSAATTGARGALAVALGGMMEAKLDAKTLSPSQLSSKYKKPLSKIYKEIDKGSKVEREHTRPYW